MKEELAKRREAIEEARKTRQDLEGRCKQLEAEGVELGREITRLKTKLEVSSKSDVLLKQLRDSSGSLKTERDGLKLELDAVKQQLSDLKVELKAKDSNTAKTRELSKTLKEKEIRVIDLEKEVASLTQSKKKLKDESDRLQKLLEDYKTKTKVLDTRLEEDTKRLESELSSTRVPFYNKENCSCKEPRLREY